MKISIKIEVSQFQKRVSFEPSDIGMTDEEWVDLPSKEKDLKIREYIDDMPEQPYWVVKYYDEEY